MTKFEKKKLELELNRFITLNFEKPSNCKDELQTAYYIQELSAIIKEFKEQWNYVPESAYALLNQYNNLHQKQGYIDFVKRQ